MTAAKPWYQIHADLDVDELPAEPAEIDRFLQTVGYRLVERFNSSSGDPQYQIVRWMETPDEDDQEADD